MYTYISKSMHTKTVDVEDICSTVDGSEGSKSEGVGGEGVEGGVEEGRKKAHQNPRAGAGIHLERRSRNGEEARMVLLGRA